MAFMQQQTTPTNGKRELKIAVVGSGGVGKSAVTIRFVTSQFYDQGYNPTIEDSYRKQVVVNNEAVTLEILDTAGQEEYAAMASQWYKYANGFLLVYSITDRVSYENCILLHQDILRVKDRPFVPIILVSNKCDLSSQRMVSQNEGRDLARSFGAPFIECSAAEGVNVDVAFRQLVKLVRKDERRIASHHEQILAGPISGPGLAYNQISAETSYRDRDRRRSSYIPTPTPVSRMSYTPTPTPAAIRPSPPGYQPSPRHSPSSPPRREKGGKGKEVEKGCCIVM